MTYANGLTAINNAKPGDEVCLSFCHPLFGREFTTYRLAAQHGEDDFGSPLFNLAEAEVQITRDIWATWDEIREAKRTLTLKGLALRMTAFGHHQLCSAPSS